MGFQNVCACGNRLEWNLLIELDVLFENIPDTSHHGFNIRSELIVFMDPIYFHLKIVGVIQEVFDAAPLKPFHQHFHRPVRQLEDLQNIRNRTDFKNIYWLGIIVVGVTLG